MASTIPPQSLTDLVELINTHSHAASSTATATHTLPSTDAIITTLSARYKAELPYIHCGYSTLIAINPLRPLESINDASAQSYLARIIGGEDDEEEDPSSARSINKGKRVEAVQPHPYEFAARIHLALQRTGRSQAVVFSGLTGSGKTYTSRLITSLVLRAATHHSFGTSSHSKVIKLRDQIKASEVLLDAFGSCKTSSSNNATRQGRILELHFHSEDSITKILSGAKLLTFGFDKSRLNHPLGREERSFHILYQFLAGASNEERNTFKLLSDPSQYNLLASSGTYRIENVNDAIEFEELRNAFNVLGFKLKHLEMIYKILSAVLLLGNIGFSQNTGLGDNDNNDDSMMISHETREEFDIVASLLGLQSEDLERTLINKTSYIRKEVITTVLTEEGCIKQRNDLMNSLYSILFSYIVESINHKLYPGDEVIKNLQRDKEGNSIILFDLPGFQTKSPNGALLDDGSSSSMSRRTTLVQAYGEDNFEEFIINYQNELLQHWLFRRDFIDDSCDLNKNAISDGIIYPEVDAVDTSEMTLELLRGGAIGSRSDSKIGGLLAAANKSCSGLRKGKIVISNDADDSFIGGLEERYKGHSRFIPRLNGTSSTSFAIKHYTGTVSYSARQFVEKDLDLLDSEFVRLFRNSSSESFLAKLFSGPSLAAESHPRDTSVLVATQISSQPLRRLSPLKVSKSISTSVPSDPPEPDIKPITTQINNTLTGILAQLNEIPLWHVNCLRPNDHSSPGIFDLRRIKSQVDTSDLRSLLARKRIEYIDYIDTSKFIKRYSPIGATGGANNENIEKFLQNKKFERGKSYHFGIKNNTIWLSFDSWFELEMGLVNYETIELTKKRKILAETKKSLERGNKSSSSSSSFDGKDGSTGRPIGFPGLETSPSQDTFQSHQADIKSGTGFYAGESSDDLLKNAGNAGGAVIPTLPYDSNGLGRPNPNYLRQSSLSFSNSNAGVGDVWGSDFKQAQLQQPSSPSYLPNGNGGGGNGKNSNEKGGNGNGKKGQTVEEVPTSSARRMWLILVWTLTWWIPGFLLGWIGRMKRPDVRIAWREKVALCILVAFFCGLLLFLILGLGVVICPQFNYAWNAKELSYHQGRSDVWVAVAGKVYDISKFYRAQHSDIVGADVTSDDMLTLAGRDLTPYFPVPLTLGCGDFVKDEDVFLQNANFTAEVPTAFHYSGQQQSVQTSALRRDDWYTARFLPKMKQYYKGPMVYTKGQLQKGADDDQRIWAMYNKRVYDISDYIFTIKTMNDDNTYRFLPSALTDIFEQQPGTDITKAVDDLDERSLNSTMKAQALFCLDNVFYRGEFDFRTTPRCTVQSYFLLAFSIILIATIAAKFVAALQITKKRNPELQDKFVICQVPCYTEGEESLKKTIDSLANLKYDDKRKLLFVICDGMIVGSGNDRPTPRIVLDILGVENLDPDPLLFKSLGQGNKQLNYGKVYSGLYEFEGHVLPYIVVVKVGKPTERSRPGNRGKRDSQILVMRFLNRVHFDAEMAPLELEIYHQIKNVIGVDPKLYEFLLTVDADTEVKPDSLNRLIAAAADDSSIIGLCGETKLSNEQESWWTMIQVYEYYISHHLSKAFESLFGSVTCLPGCFTLFRLRTTDKGRPLLISNLVIDDYSENDVDTLHKKNLLHLGEDRYLTTLMLKHFPHFKTKFASDARAMTAAPERWNVLLSQRRRWINSTVHNLFELVALKDLCGFCCFSMRFIVIIDLLGTILLPATLVYLIYLIVTVATHKASVPVISLVMIGAVYGLQVIIFLLKRQWQFLGWLVIYILAYPIYSFFLPIYAFWHFDDFSWGNTRIVVGEGKNKKILAGDDDKFDDSMIPMRKFNEYQQAAWNTHAMGTSPGAMTTNFSDPQRGHSPHGSFVPGQPSGYAGPFQSSRPGSRSASIASFPAAPQSIMNYPAGPQPVFSPFSDGQYGGYGSPAGSVIGGGSDYGGPTRNLMLPNAALSQNPLRQSTMSFAASQFGGPGSMLGMPGQSFVQPMHGFNPATARNSSYSLAQWAGSAHRPSQSMGTLNPFSDSTQMPQAADLTNPTDAELVQALRVYLRTQDLLQVTKRSTREAMACHFEQADLTKRKNFLNQSIDAILQGQL